MIHTRLLCLALLCAPLAGAAQSGPFLANGSFEEGLDGWSHNSSATVASGDAAEGTHRVVLEASEEKRVRLQTEIIDLTVGRTYLLRYHSRRCTSADARVVVRNVETNRYLASGRLSETAGWKPRELRFTATATSARLEVRLAAAGVVEVDQFSIEAVD
jgi:Carbohydrate binding domain.